MSKELLVEIEELHRYVHSRRYVSPHVVIVYECRFVDSFKVVEAVMKDARYWGHRCYFIDRWLDGDERPIVQIEAEFLLEPFP